MVAKGATPATYSVVATKGAEVDGGLLASGAGRASLEEWRAMVALRGPGGLRTRRRNEGEGYWEDLTTLIDGGRLGYWGKGALQELGERLQSGGRAMARYK